jgi:integrase/recombinase XerC
VTAFLPPGTLVTIDNPLAARYLTAQRGRRMPFTTARAKATALRSLVRFLANRYEVDPMTPDLLLAADLADLLAWQQQLTISDRSVACYAAHVRVFYRWACSRAAGRLLVEDPSAELPLPATHRGVPRPIGSDDLFAAIDLAKASDPVIYCWLMLMAACGLRCCEVARLTRRAIAVDEATQSVRITVRGKGGRLRVRDGGPGVLNALRPFLLGSDVLFRTIRADGSAAPVTEASVSRQVNRFLRHEVGLTDTAHSLRHWFATAAYRLRRDLVATQHAMGHATPVHTVGYVALVDEPGGTLGAEVDAVLRAGQFPPVPRAAPASYWSRTAREPWPSRENPDPNP